MGLCMSKQQSDGDDSTHFEMAGGNVDLVITKEAWEGKLSQASREGKIVVANFSAAWCGPCKMIAPYYSELSEKYPSFMFLTIDVDELCDLSTSFDIKATPTFFFLKDGQQIEKLVGANKPELLKKITAILDSQIVASFHMNCTVCGVRRSCSSSMSSRDETSGKEALLLLLGSPYHIHKPTLLSARPVAFVQCYLDWKVKKDEPSQPICTLLLWEQPAIVILKKMGTCIVGY